MKKLFVGVLVALPLVVAAALPAAGSRPTVRFVCFDKSADAVGAGSDGIIRGTRGDDVIVTFTRHVRIFGRGGSDRICTGSGHDYIVAGRGNDLVSSGAGHDEVLGGRGHDYLNGRQGADRLVGGSRDTDTLVGGDGADRLFGGADSYRWGDFLFGGPGDDLLRGGDGSIASDPMAFSDGDHLIGGSGADRIDGGAGPGDSVSFAFEDVPVQADLGTSMVLATGDRLRDIEHLGGTVHDDVIGGDASGNSIAGDDGNDAIAAGAGHDELHGGEGDDVLDGDADGDVASFRDAAGGVSADLLASTASGAGTDELIEVEALDGSVFDDVLYGDAGPNMLDGSKGQDELYGREGDDHLVSGSGDAGEGEDWCYDSTAVSCEHFVVSAPPPPHPTVTFPIHAQRYPIAALTAIEGTAPSGGGSTVRVALRRWSSSGCYWWDARHAMMQDWHCARPLWGTSRVREDRSWRHRIGDPVQVLDTGRYDVHVDFDEPRFVPGFLFHVSTGVEFRLR